MGLKLVCASGDNEVRRAKGRLELMTHRTRNLPAVTPDTRRMTATIRIAQTWRIKELTISLEGP